MAAIGTFNRKLLQVSATRGFWLKPLGVVDDYITWLIMTRKPSEIEPIAKKMLVIGGIHGEEPAGALAILKWLEEANESTLALVNMSFIPIINSYGFANKKRYGLSGIPTNGGFGSFKTQDPSPEGQLIVNNIGLLRSLAADGFMSLHEDNTIKESYIYTLEQSQEPTKFTLSLRRELKKHFPKMFNGIAAISPVDLNTGPQCNRGLIYNYMDDSVEALMFQLGVPRCAVPETPAKRIPLKKRVEAHVAMINKFIELCLKE